jgi:hypothetical protein
LYGLVDRRIELLTVILGKNAKLPCTIRNLSEFGASLELSATFGVPSTFLFGTTGHTPRPCKVIWRTDRMLGVHFDEPIK